MPHVRIWARYGRAPAYVSSVRTLPPTVAAALQQIPTPGQVNGGEEKSPSKGIRGYTLVYSFAFTRLDPRVLT